ncbi:MAG: hypothetical protein LWW86_10240 [Micrococcales bacterium]|nr:hypothetical protein [Micrococcales bacterium]
MDGLNAGYGLLVRWSLDGTGQETAAQLRQHVVGTSMARFMFQDGLAFKVWRMSEGAWFEGTYVFATEAARDDFRERYAAQGDDCGDVTAIIGSPPQVVEAYEVVAIAEGPEGFRCGPGPITA